MDAKFDIIGNLPHEVQCLLLESLPARDQAALAAVSRGHRLIVYQLGVALLRVRHPMQPVSAVGVLQWAHQNEIGRAPRNEEALFRQQFSDLSASACGVIRTERLLSALQLGGALPAAVQASCFGLYYLGRGAESAKLTAVARPIRFWFGGSLGLGPHYAAHPSAAVIALTSTALGGLVLRRYLERRRDREIARVENAFGGDFARPLLDGLRESSHSSLASSLSIASGTSLAFLGSLFYKPIGMSLGWFLGWSLVSYTLALPTMIDGRDSRAEHQRAALRGLLDRMMERDLIASRYRCAVSKRLLKDPVLRSDGRYVEREYFRDGSAAAHPTTDPRPPLLIAYRKLRLANAIGRSVVFGYGSVSSAVISEIEADADRLQRRFSTSHPDEAEAQLAEIQQADHFIDFAPL